MRSELKFVASVAMALAFVSIGNPGSAEVLLPAGPAGAPMLALGAEDRDGILSIARHLYGQEKLDHRVGHVRGHYVRLKGEPTAAGEFRLDFVELKANGSAFAKETYTFRIYPDGKLAPVVPVDYYFKAAGAREPLGQLDLKSPKAQRMLREELDFWLDWHRDVAGGR